MEQLSALSATSRQSAALAGYSGGVARLRNSERQRQVPGNFFRIHGFAAPIAADDEEIRAQPAEWKGLERGWIHGGQEFRARMLDGLRTQGALSLDHLADGEQKRDLSEAEANRILEAGLNHFGLERAELPKLPKSDPRKMLLAGLLRRHYPVSVAWVSQSLAMGHFTTVCRAMHFYDEAKGRWEKDKKHILKSIG